MSTGAATVLDRILAETRTEVERRKRELPLEALSATGAGDRRGHAFADALRAPGVGVIAEFKRRSPSVGEIRSAPDVAEIVGAYERGGAVAVSVLTEGPNFDGSLEDLRAARAATTLPLLRKDFVVDAYQLHEARASGADAVLLIVAALMPPELAELHRQAGALGLDALVEVHDEEELAVALGAGAEIVGINNRDLRDFSVDVRRSERLMERMPAGVIAVSESGIDDPAQLAVLGSHGVAAVLVGEALMRAPDPARKVRSLNI
jgi:indole-3-glycerol phosphate synthase